MTKQRVLITAEATGIGREIARAFVAIEAALFVCDIDTKALEAIAAAMPELKTGICDMSSRQRHQENDRRVREGSAGRRGLRARRFSSSCEG